jgi:hypothetical protein
VALGRLEPEERARADHGVLGTGGNLHSGVDDEHPGVFPHLMLAESGQPSSW